LVLGPREIRPGPSPGRRQPCRSSNQVTVRPPRRCHPHRAASPATSPSPRPPSASPSAGHSRGIPGPLLSVTSTRTTPSPAVTATVTVWPGRAERLYRTLLPKSSSASKTATSPHGCPGPSTPSTNVRATRARSARPASVTLSRTAVPAISAPALPRPPRKITGSPGGHTGDARSTQRRASSRNALPTRPVRGRPWKADGYADRPGGPDAVRYMSVDTATQGTTALQGDTRRDKKKTARIAENSQLSGRFPRVWQVLGSNQRRLSRRFTDRYYLHLHMATDLRK